MRAKVEHQQHGDFMTPYELKLAPLPCRKSISRADRTANQPGSEVGGTLKDREQYLRG